MRRWPVWMYLGGMGGFYLLYALRDLLIRFRSEHGTERAFLPSALWALALGTATLVLLLGVVRRNLLAPLCFTAVAAALAAFSYQTGNTLATTLNLTSIALLGVIALASRLSRA